MNKRKQADRPNRVTGELVAKLAAHLTERDRRIAVECYEHNVLTTDQLTRLYFPTSRITTSRLQLLYSLRVLDRFRPIRRRGDGTAPYHWILDEAGALIVADHKGIQRSELHYSHADALSLATSRNLAHHVEGNEFFTRLAVEASHAGGGLSEWYGVRTLAHLFASATIPDGYGVLTMPRRPPTHLLLELDRGTEASRVLRAKADSYARTLPVSSLHDHQPLVLLAVPSERRAQTARAAVENAGAPIAVAVWSAASSTPTLNLIEAAVSRAGSATSSGVADHAAGRWRPD